MQCPCTHAEPAPGLAATHFKLKNTEVVVTSYLLIIVASSII